jgi:NTE family protein
MKISFLALTLLLTMSLQSAALGHSNSKNKTQSDSNDGLETEVVSDSFEKELAQTKQQIDESAPEDQIKQVLPESGQVLNAKQKHEAIQESSKINNQNPVDVHKIPAKNPDGTPTVAIALGGGGARGAAHIGVLKVFEEEGIPINQVVGNSMGAIVGGLYCAGISLDNIQAELEDLKLTHAYMPGGIVKRFITIPLTQLASPFMPKHYPGLWSGKKLTRYFDKILPRPNMDISDTKIPFSTVATNLLDGKAYRITKGRLSTAIKASAAIPSIIQPVAIGNHLFVDGGVRANLPASAARDTGAGLVIAVLVDEPMPVLPAKKFLHTSTMVSRLSDIVLAVADERQLQYADIIINPNISGIAVLSNNPKDVTKAVKAGELAARKALPELRKRLHLPAKPESKTAS